MNRLSKEQQARVVAALVEGNSIRAPTVSGEISLGSGSV